MLNSISDSSLGKVLEEEYHRVFMVYALWMMVAMVMKAARKKRGKMVRTIQYLEEEDLKNMTAKKAPAMYRNPIVNPSKNT